VADNRTLRFGQFELDVQTGELRKGARVVRLQDQPLKILLMLLESPGGLVTREQMRQQLWATDTFVDFEHSLSAAINKLRGALGDSATNPVFIETLPRKGYRFIAPVSGASGASAEQASAEEPDSLFTRATDVPAAPPRLALGIFSAIQVMYLAFYISALAGLHELQDRLAVLGLPTFFWIVVIALAVLGIPLRLYFLSSASFRAKTLVSSFLRLFPIVFAIDAFWAASPLLITHRIGWGFALAAVAGLAYLPFSQRTLLLMAERKG
jgi:cholera toxin transcriptional activator